MLPSRTTLVPVQTAISLPARAIGGLLKFTLSRSTSKAQAEPEKYQNLTVRLWGFPAYFVRLPKEFQEHIIARTSHVVQ